MDAELKRVLETAKLMAERALMAAQSIGQGRMTMAPEAEAVAAAQAAAAAANALCSYGRLLVMVNEARVPASIRAPEPVPKPAPPEPVADDAFDRYVAAVQCEVADIRNLPVGDTTIKAAVLQNMEIIRENFTEGVEPEETALSFG